VDKATDVIPWGGIYESWASKHARLNEWTVQQSAQWMDWRDLLQEFALVFWKCQQRLDESRITGGEEGRQKALFGMFKTACRRRMTDILRSHVIVRNHPDQRRPCQFAMSSFEDDEGFSTLPEPTAPTPWIDAEMAEALRDAPDNVRVYITECVLGNDEPQDRRAIEAVVGVPMSRLKKQVTAWAERRMILLQNPALAY
jgi:hypothetical protein